ncbi:MAG: protein translocase subunit SecD, partial [Bacteroidia bacterium]|nr:protein translocase subunit SecD [Bacteroidia bacterium]
MQNKGAIKLFALLLALCCVFYLLFTWVVYDAESDAKAQAEQRVQKSDTIQKRITALSTDTNGVLNQTKKTKWTEFYKDSMNNAILENLSSQKIFDIGITDFTYEDCKKRELNMGLDLRGGINVILEVSVGDIIKGLSGNNKDEKFLKALQNAKEKLGGQNSDFVELFAKEYATLAPGKNLANFFQTTEIRNKIEYNASNDKVVAVVREEVSASLKNVENTLRSRIQNIGVSQPNIRSIGSQSSGRVLVELPGAKNIEKVKTLLERTANLEFWETYDNIDLNPSWDGANKAVRQFIIRDYMGDKEEKRIADSTKRVKAIEDSIIKVKIAKGEKVDTTKKEIVDTTSLLGKTKKEKDKTANDRLRDSIGKVYPISKLLYPRMDQKGYLLPGPVVGYCSKNDTAKLMAYLNHPEVKKKFPKNVKFAFGAYPLKESNGTYEVYALKSSEYTSLKPALFGDVIDNAKQGFDQAGNANIDMAMKGAAADQWSALTKRVADQMVRGKTEDENFPKAIAIVMDNIVFSAPGVSRQITGGRSEINGSFDIKEAQSLASVLSAGKLPAPAKIVASSEVGATLGQEAIDNGILSFIGSIIIILLFMVLYYNKAGAIADLALFINIFFIMGVLAAWGEVLTLPGIAGIVLTIGLSVDANILIFERVREELALGKSNALAIREGFKHAMSSIIDSNVTL